jgi:hypothetical protein
VVAEQTVSSENRTPERGLEGQSNKLLLCPLFGPEAAVPRSIDDQQDEDGFEAKVNASSRVCTKNQRSIDGSRGGTSFVQDMGWGAWT